MVIKFLRRLMGGGGGEPAARHEAVEYQGYRIEATPQKQDGGWLTCGVISHEVAGEVRSHRFVRADTSTSEDAAVELTVRKAQRLIDEQGERLFGAG